jgi:acyl-CoA thioester hydrolase
MSGEMNRDTSGNVNGKTGAGVGAPAAGPGDEPPLRRFALRIVTGDEDLPEDRFNDHVNNARYFAFINRCFQGWYRAIGIRGGIPGQSGVMAHLEYDFLREVKPPAIVEVRIEVARSGRTSLEHAIEIHDLGPQGTGAPLLAGRGRAVHVWLDRETKRSLPWPEQVLARCWRAG